MPRLLCAALILGLCALLVTDISAQQKKPVKKADPVVEALKNTSWKSAVNSDQLFLVLIFDAEGSGEISWRTTAAPNQPLGGRPQAFPAIEKQGKTYYIVATQPSEPGINYTPTKWVLQPSADKKQLTVKGASKKYVLSKQERKG